MLKATVKAGVLFQMSECDLINYKYQMILKKLPVITFIMKSSVTTQEIKRMPFELLQHIRNNAIIY